MRISKAILLLLAAGAAVLLGRYYPLMPETMASHFDGAGRPNAFQSREGFFLLSGAMLLLVVVVFGGLGPLLRRLPPYWLNVPNREYWLAPERRAATLDFMARQMDWFGVASLVVLIGTLGEAFAANLSGEPRLDSETMWWLLGGYFLFLAVWLFRFLTRFRLPAAQRRTESS